MVTVSCWWRSRGKFIHFRKTGLPDKTCSEVEWLNRPRLRHLALEFNILKLVETLATPLDPTDSRGVVCCTIRCTPCYLHHQHPGCIYSAMYSIINQFGPNCCPAYCLSTLVTRIRSYLLYCTLYFLSLTRPGYRAPAALCFAHISCLTQLSQALQLLHVFPIDFTLKSAKTISFLLDRDSVITALSFHNF